MKKYHIWLSVLGAFVFLPFISQMSSCAAIDNKLSTISTSATFTDSKKVKELKKTSSMKSFLFGNKSFNGGNYVVVFSSSSSEGLSELFFNLSYDQLVQDKCRSKNWVFDPNSSLGAAIDNINQQVSDRSSNKIEKLPFVWLNFDDRYYENVSDDPNSALTDHIIEPFIKWTATDEQNYKFDKHRYPKAKEGKYVRNDNRAKSYRSVSSYINTLYSISGENSIVMMEFVKGRYANNAKTDDYDDGNGVPSEFTSPTDLTTWAITGFDTYYDRN